MSTGSTHSTRAHYAAKPKVPKVKIHKAAVHKMKKAATAHVKVARKKK